MGDASSVVELRREESGVGQPEHLVYVRATEKCNLRCDHCFAPPASRSMSAADFAEIPAQVRKFAAPGSRIVLQWHGGEPTLLGPTRMEEAIAIIEGAGRDYCWEHSIQTNLVEYSSAWHGVLQRRFRNFVGVSWDPEIRFFQGSNEKYESRFWRNVERALTDGLTLQLVVTGTRVFFEHYRTPTSFFRFLAERGIRLLHIERLTPTGNAVRHWNRLGMSNAEYSAWMSRFAAAYIQWKRRSDVPSLCVSPFDGLFHSVRRMSPETAYGCWSGRCDTQFHTVGPHGYHKGCTALTCGLGEGARAPDWAVVRQTRQVMCLTCDFRVICAGACHALSVVDGSGECAGGRKLFETIRDVMRFSGSRRGG